MCDIKDRLRAACADNEDAPFDLPEGFEEVDEGDWTQEGKYQTNKCVVKHTATGKCFEIYQRRSGSYHTDWYYNTPDVGNEVRKVTKTITIEEWEAVSNV
jgi:hypothetical protein